MFALGYFSDHTSTSHALAGRSADLAEFPRCWVTADMYLGLPPVLANHMSHTGLTGHFSLATMIPGAAFRHTRGARWEQSFRSPSVPG